MKHFIRTCAVLTASILTMVGLTAAPASAAPPTGSCVSNQDSIGCGFWYYSGDKMLVCDTARDGRSVVVVAWLNDVRAADKWHTAGAGPPSNPLKCTDRSYGNLIEGTHIDFMACSGNYSPYVIYWDTCGYMVSDSA